MRRIALLLIVSFAAVFSVHAAPAAEKYRIGAILPLSGSNASLGHYIKNGLDLAYAQLPADRQAKLELIYEDDQLQSANAVSAFQRLRSQQNIDAAFVLGSGIGNAVAPLAEKAGVLLVAIVASDGSITKNRRYAFLHWVTPDTEARTMVDELVRRKYKRLAIVGTQHEGAQALVTALKKALDERGLSGMILSDQEFLPSERSFGTQIAKLKSQHADGVVVLLFPGALASFAKQTKELEFTADLVGMELFEDESEVKASDGALVGQWYVNADSGTSNFEQLYRAAYKEQPGLGAANAYDSLMLVAEAANAHGKNNAAVADYLATLKNYSGAAGKYSATGDNRFGLPAAIKIVRENGFEKLQR